MAQATVREKYLAAAPALTAQPAVTETEDRVEIAMTTTVLLTEETALSALRENTKTTTPVIRPAPEAKTEKEPHAARMTAAEETSVPPAATMTVQRDQPLATVTEPRAVTMTEAGSKDRVHQTEPKEAATQEAVKTVTAKAATENPAHLLAQTVTTVLQGAETRDAALAALKAERTEEAALDHPAAMTAEEKAVKETTVALTAVETVAVKVVSILQKARNDSRRTRTQAEVKAEKSVQETNAQEMSVRANLRTDLSVRLM